MKNPMLFLFAVLITLPHFSCSNPHEPGNTLIPFPDLSGPYLGQMLPDSVPELFAPGVVSTGMFTRDVAISPDGDELVGDQDIWVAESFSLLLQTMEHSTSPSMKRVVP